MPIRTLDVTPEILMSICTATREGDDVRSFRVIENGLPHDVQLVRTTLTGNPSYPVIRLYLQSESFTNEEELPPPVLRVVSNN